MIENSTFSTSGGTTMVLNEKTIVKAINTLKKLALQPYLTCIKSRYEWKETIKKSKVARDFMVFGGIPVFKDLSIPVGKVRFEMSDGTYNDYDIQPVLNLLK